MAWLRKFAALALALALASVGLALLNPDPPQARANVLCEVGISPGSAVTGALGIGNPVGDACNAVTDPVLGPAEEAVLDPVKEAVGSVASSIGQSVFKQITNWASDGAVWLLEEVVELTEKTTSPNLLSKGFLRQYRQMASIAVALALAMLIFAALEGLGRGDGGMLWRVFLVNVPVAALATSAAYVLVQLLVATTDGFSEVIAHSTAHDTREFFKSAIGALAEVGGEAGALTGEATLAGATPGKAMGAAITGETTGAGGVGGKAVGSVAMPLFVSFIAAIVAAVAAFLVWIELLMRAAAIYAVALFMPLALAASIWPRWTGALKRTAELIVVVVFSKFVIVAVIALAASLLANAEGKVEHVLSAGALLLLACFSPVVLFRLAPFAEGAVSSAFSRQSPGGTGIQAIHTASSVQMMRRSAQANWGGSSSGAGAAGGGGKGGRSSAAAGGAKASGSAGEAAAGGASAGAASGPASLPVVAGVGAAKAGKAGAGRLSHSGTAQAGSDSGSGPTGAGAGAGGQGRSQPAQPARASGEGARSAPPPSPAPTEAKGGGSPSDERKAPRPSGGAGGSNKGGAGGTAKP